ncbi:MAG: methyltransferase domain-containing protein, partial [Acidimicrobiales bacterium]
GLGEPGPGREPPADVAILELGVGTGRLAIPLADLGFEVWGVDASPAMLERLAGKPGGDRVRAVVADMADVGLGVDSDGTRTGTGVAVGPGTSPGTGTGTGTEGTDVERATEPRGVGAEALGDRRFRLVVAAFNTFFNLTSEAAQARCLAGAARRLAPGGRVVIEAFVPSLPRLPSTGVVEVGRIETDRVVLNVSRVRPDDQVVDGNHVELSVRGNRLRPWSIRFLTPPQLDAMAGAAGLSLVDRWAGWRDQPFDDTSTLHVSAYGLRRSAQAER